MRPAQHIGKIVSIANGEFSEVIFHEYHNISQSIKSIFSFIIWRRVFYWELNHS